jgi:hypothetical protein
MTHLRLTDPVLPFWVDVQLSTIAGCSMAVADLAGTPEVGLHQRPDVALLLALWPLGPEAAQRLARSAGVDQDGPVGGSADVSG